MENQALETHPRQLMINEAQLILAEKRTSMAGLRTGLALLGLPLALVSFLIAMSRYYHVSAVWPYLIPVLLICACLGALGGVICFRAARNLKKAEAHLQILKKKCSIVSDELD